MYLKPSFSDLTTVTIFSEWHKIYFRRTHAKLESVANFHLNKSQQVLAEKCSQVSTVKVVQLKNEENGPISKSNFIILLYRFN